MKKFLVSILFLVMFIPVVAFAATTSYEQLNIKYNFEIGTQVDKLQYQIYANTNDNEILKDRTSEFTAEFSVFKVNEDNSREFLPAAYILRNDETYGFTLSNIKPNNDATMNINDISKVLINSSEQDNDTLKISIANNVLNVEYTMPKVKVIDENKFEAIEEEEKEENKCILGLSLCCNEYKGVSYCILGVIGLVALIVIITVINVILDKKDDKKYKDF